MFASVLCAHDLLRLLKSILIRVCPVYSRAFLSRYIMFASVLCAHDLLRLLKSILIRVYTVYSRAV